MKDKKRNGRSGFKNWKNFQKLSKKWENEL